MVAANFQGNRGIRRSGILRQFLIFHCCLETRLRIYRTRTQPILTARMAKKIFGNESPLDKTIRIDNRIEFKITGVLKDIPDNTDLRSEIYLSYSTIKQYNEWYAEEDAWEGITTQIQAFARLRPGASITEIESKLHCICKEVSPGK